MGPVDETASLARLARAVSGRRQRIGSSQDAVADYGGPSDRTLREVENATATTLTPTTLRKLDQGLLWDTGTARAVLENAISPEEAVAARQVVYASGLRAARETRAEVTASRGVDRQVRRAQRATAARRGARMHHEAADARDPGAEARAAGSQFRASKPLAEALAALQDIDNPTVSERRAIGLVWRALRGVMDDPDKQP